MTTQTSSERALAQLIIETLDLQDVKAEDIEPAAPLFREGLGLDSIDALEISLAVSQKYGVQLRADDANNKKIFASLRSLAEHIDKHRAAA